MRRANSSNLSTADAIKVFGGLTGIAAALSFFVIVLGSAVRSTNSGLACPDWPLCFSQLVPQFDFHVFMEWFHRLVAGTLCLIVLGIVVKLVRVRELRKLFGAQLAVAVGLLTSQVILGGLTVLHLLEPKIVSLHLINAMLFMSVLLWMSAKAELLSRVTASHPFHIPERVKWFLVAIVLTVFAQIFLGGMVSSNHAGLACSEFPTCNGHWLFGMGFQEWLQMGHRYLAYIVTAMIMFLAFMSTGLKLPSKAKLAVRLLPTLLVVQIALGVINVYWFIPVSTSVLHLANATLIFVLSFRAMIEVLYYGRAHPLDTLYQREHRSFEHPVSIAAKRIEVNN